MIERGEEEPVYWHVLSTSISIHRLEKEREREKKRRSVLVTGNGKSALVAVANLTRPDDGR